MNRITNKQRISDTPSIHAMATTSDERGDYIRPMATTSDQRRLHPTTKTTCRHFCFLCKHKENCLSKSKSRVLAADDMRKHKGHMPKRNAHTSCKRRRACKAETKNGQHKKPPTLPGSAQQPTCVFVTASAVRPPSIYMWGTARHHFPSSPATNATACHHQAPPAGLC